MENNFKCLSCTHEFHEASFSVVVIEGETAYKYKGSFLKCPECHSLAIDYIEKQGAYNVNFHLFKSLSSDEKKKVLKMRSEEHSKKKLKERREYLDRNFVGTTKGLDFHDTSN